MNLITDNITDVPRPVARIVNYLQKHFVGRTLAAVRAQHDENVFGKVGTSAAEFEKALKGKKVLSARQQGKYFWYDICGRFFLLLLPTYDRPFTRKFLLVFRISILVWLSFAVGECKMEIHDVSNSRSSFVWFHDNIG